MQTFMPKLKTLRKFKFMNFATKYFVIIKSQMYKMHIQMFYISFLAPYKKHTLSEGSNPITIYLIMQKCRKSVGFAFKA